MPYKSLVTICIFNLFVLLPDTVKAKPVGIAVVKGQILSFNTKEIIARVDGKNIKLPRSVAKEKKLRTHVEREFILSQHQLTYLKVQYFHSRKKKK